MIYMVTIAFMVLDFASGMMKAIAKEQLASKKMREGLFHKCALGLCVILGAAVDYAQTVLELGFHANVSGLICGYIIVMEIASIMENICEVNPQVTPDALRKIFGGNAGGEQHGKDE